jgi:hypothetical protein
MMGNSFFKDNTSSQEQYTMNYQKAQEKECAAEKAAHSVKIGID